VLKKIVAFFLVALWASACMAAAPERSVVQIITFTQPPLWQTPWRFGSVQRIGGSGFVIKGKRVLTNAHVISWARQIILRRYQDPRLYLAHVEYVGHDCDLAVLKPEDPHFFDGLEPLLLGALPKVRTPVVTYGYPAGGNEISYTRGVVSRIEMEGYVHIGNRDLLSVQTDAAINPGNSGGPVIQDDRVVGVAFQGIPGLQNTGFFIPTPIINHFLTDLADGHYNGFPQAGIRVMPLQNPAYRAMLKMPDNDEGVRIDGFLPGATCGKLLKMDDVILKIGPYPVGSDGTILYQGNRIGAALGFQLAQDGQSVPLELWRDGGETNVSLPVHVDTADRATGNEYDPRPRYFVYGGLVFVPLNLDYIRAVGRGVASDLYYQLFYQPYENPPARPKEPVVLSTVLSDEVNANIGVRGGALVARINGHPINCLRDVAQAFETNTNRYDTIAFSPHHAVECLDRQAVLDATPGILKNYRLISDRHL
jgi:S1-C subfamily serine protease